MNKHITVHEWGKVDDEIINLYTLTNENGVIVTIANFGAAVQSVLIPDKHGNYTDVILGYDTLEGYINDEFYIGTVVGRYANRIAGGLVKIKEKVYQLSIKKGGFHHHGGESGFNKKVWKAKIVNTSKTQCVQLSYLSVKGEEGFPGNLKTTVTYTLNDKNQLIVDYKATTDQPTIVNLTQHMYFNLEGHNAGSILDHELLLPSKKYLPVNNMQVPDGEPVDVKGTPFDYNKLKAIGKDIDQKNNQLALSFGYDHSWVIKDERNDKLFLAAKVNEPESGRRMNVYTTEPSVHLYTGNFLDAAKGKDKSIYGYREGFCLETQNHPDSPNHSNFPSSVLLPGEVYISKTIFEFEWDKK